MNATTNKPTPDIRIKDVTIFVDPFEDFLAKKRSEEQQAKDPRAGVDEDEESRRAEDDRMTWTGKRVRNPGSTAPSDSSGGGVGKYLKAALADRQGQEEDEIVEFVDEPEPARKKAKGTGGFGDFSSW